MASDIVEGGGGLAGRSISWFAAVRFAIVPVLLLVGLLSSAASATEPDVALALSDFDQAGLEADVLALVEAGAVGGEPALYAASGSSWSASGSLVDGELGLGSGDEAIVRVAVMGGGEVLRFNDAGSLSLSAYFGASGAGSDLTVWVQTAASTVSFAASDVKSAGGNYVNVNVPADARSVLSGIGSGDRFILALTRPATLVLSDFDQAGLEADVLALVEAGAAGAEPALYAASGSSWSVSGSLEGGELGLGSGDEAIVRVAVMGGGEVLRFNDAGSLSLGAYFGASGTGGDLTVWVQTAASTVSFAASDVKSAGGNYVNVNVPADARSALSGIGSGDRFILALTRPATTPVDETPSTGLSTKGENGKSGVVARTEPDPPPQEVSPISLSVDVEEFQDLGVNAAVRVSVHGLHDDDDQEGQPDYTYRIDIVDDNGVAADACEGVGMNEQKRLFATYFDWFLLADGPYVLDAETSELGADAGCAYASSYTVNASISDDEGKVLATASATFEVLTVQYSHDGDAPTLTAFSVSGTHQVTKADDGPVQRQHRRQHCLRGHSHGGYPAVHLT